MAALADRYENAAGVSVIYSLGGLAIVVGTLLIAVATWRTRVVPRWAAVARVAGTAANITGFTMASQPVLAVSYVLLLAAFVPFAVRLDGDHGRVREQPWRRRPLRGSAVVVELQGDVEVGAAQQLLHRLQVVALLAADPQLVALDLRLDALGALVADELGDLLGGVGLDALLDPGGDLVDLARGLRLVGVQRLQRDARA